MMRTLCLSIHDVAPATWIQCRILAAAIAEVDPRLPVTLLVVPDYHGTGGEMTPAYRAWLAGRVARGDEIALHGYNHLDSAAHGLTFAEKVRREIYTAREGEFAALSRHEAERRIAAGREWCAAHGWRVRGFVAPAWLMSEGTWQALRRFDFSYTTTLTRFHLLPDAGAIRAPALVYSARSAWRRCVSRWWNAVLSRACEPLPVLRIGLHPADMRHPGLVLHAQKLLDRARRDRVGLTKGDFAVIASCGASSMLRRDRRTGSRSEIED